MSRRRSLGLEGIGEIEDDLVDMMSSRVYELKSLSDNKEELITVLAINTALMECLTTHIINEGDKMHSYVSVFETLKNKMLKKFGV